MFENAAAGKIYAHQIVVFRSAMVRETDAGD